MLITPGSERVNTTTFSWPDSGWNNRVPLHYSRCTPDNQLFPADLDV